jgi:hypothetical protein
MPTDPFCAHALNRCLERIGFVPTREETLAVQADILARRALLLRRQPCGREMWLVVIRGQEVRVVLQPDSGIIVTVLEVGMPLRRVANARPRRHEPPPYRNGKRLKRRGHAQP